MANQNIIIIYCRQFQNQKQLIKVLPTQPNFYERSGSKQQLTDLPLFDANEDREILGGWHFGAALVVGLVTGGSDLSPTVCGLQLVTSTSTSSPDLEDNCQRLKSGSWSLFQRLDCHQSVKNLDIPLGGQQPCHPSIFDLVIRARLDLSRTVCGRSRLED